MLVLLVTSAACASLGPNVLESSFSDEQIEPRQATAADAIKVYWLDAETDIPQGVVFRSPSERSFEDRLQLEPGFPSAEDPHVWTGSYLVRFANNFDRETLLDAFREEAARSGANALFIERKANVAHAKAAYLSGDSPDVEIRPAAELLAPLRAMEGYSVLQSSQISLEEAGRITIDGQRGQCYFLVFALEEEALLNSNARQSFRFLFHSDDKTIDDKPPRPQFEELTADDRLSPRSRAGFLRVGCLETSAAIEVELFTGSDRHRSYRLGEGEMAMEVLVADDSEEVPGA